MASWVFGFLLFSASDAVDPSKWYQRYPHYHPYCSTNMRDRGVPPLRDQRATKLLHVSAVIRHGARTPWEAHEQCWDGYLDPGADTAEWNCTLTTLLAPPSPRGIERDEGQEQVDSPMFLFEKHYTALQNPEVGLSNYLGGTCEVGQLLLQGYEQELANGKHLREAYIFSSNDSISRLATMHDVRTQLIDVDELLWDEPGQLYYRADDDQRTLMSGQVLLRGMFGPELNDHYSTHGEYPVLPLRTADRRRDIVDPNESICPRLAEISEEFFQSEEFQAFNQTEEAISLREFKRNVLKVNGEMMAVDCLMTTMCTDRTLPEPLQDYNPDSVGMFERLYDWHVKSFTMIYNANDAIYSKLSMQPLWSEIMENIRQVKTTLTVDATDSGTHSWPKLALYSGHDTTLMPLLASLGPKVWDQKWSPYASMLILEVHGLLDENEFITGHLFRLMYNGEAITNRLEGCPDDTDLCDLSVLLELTEPFSHADQWDCTPQNPRPPSNADTPFGNYATSSQRQSRPSVLYGFLLSIGSAIVGAALTVYELKRRGLLGKFDPVADKPLEVQMSSLDLQEDERDVIINRIWNMSGQPISADRKGKTDNMTDVSINEDDRSEDIISRILS